MITQPYPNFIRPDSGGNVKPISNGLIYIGKKGLDPVSNPIDVFYIDNAGTEQKIDQPIRLNATGITVAGENDGTIILPYAKESVYSILITDKIGDHKYTDLTATGYASAKELDEAITVAQNDIVGGSIFKGSNGEYVQNGDVVALGTTHLRVLIGGEPTIVSMSPIANGVISSLTDNGATIGATSVSYEPLDQNIKNLAKQPDIIYDLHYTSSTGTNNSPNINAIIGQIITENSPLGFGKVALREGGQIGISNQIHINEKSVIISGNNSIIKWIGSEPTTESMIRIDDSSRCKLEEMVLSGNLDNPPFAAIRFYRSTAVDEVGTNENHVVDHVIIGRRFLKDTTTGGSADDTPNGRLQNGIVIDGIDGNNDEYVIKSTQIHNCDGDGITFANTQSIWSRIQDTLLNNNNVGVRAGCNLIMQNPTFNRNALADVYGTRNIELKIDGFNAENSELFTLSEGGASFFIDGGKFLMNRSDRSDFFRTLSGGALSVLNATIDNVEGTEQRVVYYRAGSSKPTLVRFDCPFIRGGEDRDNWDIDSSNEDTCIDIKYRDFEFKTNKPYADRQIIPPTVLNDESGLVASGFHTSPLGDFYNVAYLGDNGIQHITPAFESDSQIRARIYNVSGASKTLSTSRFRWLNLTDKIERLVVKSFDLPTINSFKSTTFDVSVPGVNFGDIISVGAKSNTLGLMLSAYVKSHNVVTVVASNVSGGTANPSLIDFTIGVVKPFGNRFGGKEVSTQNIASGATIEIDVNCAGAKKGSHAFFTPPGDSLGLTMSCYALNDSVKILITNMTDAAIDTPDGSWTVMCAI